MCLAAYEPMPGQLMGPSNVNTNNTDAANNTMMPPMPCRRPTHPATSWSWDAASIDHIGGIWHSSLPPTTGCLFTGKIFHYCHRAIRATNGMSAVSIDGRATNSEHHVPPMSCHGAFGRPMGGRHWGGNKYGTNFHGAICAANVMSCVPVYLAACNCI